MSEILLKRLRDNLQEIDRNIIQLLNERAKLSIEVGKIKNMNGQEIYDPPQEKKVFDHLSDTNEGPLPDHFLKNIYREIISSSRALQAPINVAYLGPEASFTHLAAISHFGRSTHLIPQSMISEVFDHVESEKAETGVVPVENSLEGSVKHTLDRLISTPLNIQAEIFLKISHFLISHCKRKEEIKRIYSHPQALAQCQGWLKKNFPLCPTIEVESTAGAAKKIINDPEGAAIGSRIAAMTYGLNILAEGIEDNPSNTTRFLIIGKGKSKKNEHDKTSIVLGTRHTPGGLYNALKPFSKEHINLLRIESYPLRERTWEYLFFVDFDGHIKDNKTIRCLTSLKEETTFIKILGSYPKGDKPC